MKPVLYISFAAALLVGCKEDSKQPVSDDPAQESALIFEGIDPSIKPGDNFFGHVNKTWYDQAVIADDQVGVGSYRFLNIPQKKLLQTILEEVSVGDYAKGSIEQKLGDFYASGMDTLSIDQRGFEPIKPILEQIDALDSPAVLIAFVADQMKVGNYSLINASIYPDQENSALNIAHFGQTGLGLPDRDYYFNTDASTEAIQKAYQNYLTTLFELIGDSNSETNAQKVYAIEKQLAASHKTRVELRDILANYHKLAVLELDKTQKNIGWKSMLEHLGMEVDSVDVMQPAYFETLNTMLKTVALDDWKTYLKANTLTAFASILSTPFQDAEFAYSKVISGQSVQKTRAERMVQQVDRQLGFALGQLYVKRYFDENAKKRALELVNNLQKSLEKRITQLDWMSDSTKVKAKEKLHSITKKIGYPDVWRSYEVDIDKTHYFENVLALNQNNYAYHLAQLNKAPNRDEWYTTPSTVTAYYNPSLNEIVFPAGILQPPYFDPNVDDAVNYGGIGMVIGHEFTHAFDDQGAQYDKEGNVKNWWTEEDYAKFKAKTQQIIEQYDAFTVLDSVHLKGALTVGENTADNGGVAIAYDAFKMTAQGQDSTKIKGYTPDQRFFMSVARIWRVKTRDEYLRNYVATDPHSPPIWRVNGPLMNMTPFYEAFDLEEGDQNFKAETDRIKVW
ncbi:M13 family metallopeptidase [Mangrovimonas sp. TPBH4]|uniref:M13 family metallopeptidase n=1 Tax=Mangrovimonas sp. TPBH4 TaxID=1645914 RepID=UPI0006B4819E|nr:M13 family metallopeptidase [Mangrovimonas sp. TPBH4]